MITFLEELRLTSASSRLFSLSLQLLMVLSVLEWESGEGDGMGENWKRTPGEWWWVFSPSCSSSELDPSKCYSIRILGVFSNSSSSVLSASYTANCRLRAAISAWRAALIRSAYRNCCRRSLF
jgi:hypothetical protein